MAPFKKKDLLPGAQAALEQAAAAAGGTSTAASKQYLSGNFANVYGLKDKSGKLLPDTINGQQFEDAFKDSKNNGPAIENIKRDLAGAKALTGTVSTTGMSNQAEQNTLSAQLRSGYVYNQDPSKPVDFKQFLIDTKNGVGPSSGQITPISYTELNLPNVEASKATINDVFQKYLGRIATEKELGEFTQKYLNYAAKNPVSTSTGQYGYNYIPTPGGTGQRLFRTSDTRQTVSTGLNEADFIANQVKAGGEYNAFQSAGNAFDLMTRMAQKDVGAL